jgi:hypothetical protein
MDTEETGFDGAMTDPSENNHTVYYTKCCDLRFIGENHSPKANTEECFVCRNCGKEWEGQWTVRERAEHLAADPVGQLEQMKQKARDEGKKNFDEMRENIRSQFNHNIDVLEQHVLGLPECIPRDKAQEKLVEFSAWVKLAVDAI